MCTKVGPIKFYALERVLAAGAAVVCVSLTVVVWLAVSQQQAMWPLPALYLLEMAVMSLIGLWGIFRADAAGSGAAWVAAGAVLGFAIIGGFSVGFFYLPVAGLLGLAALWQARLAWRRLPLQVGLALLAAVAQAVFMLALIGVLYP
jgi:hypothetical protein